MELSELTIDESIEAQPHQVFLPGCFVVLQGISGDGLANTVETGPDFAGQADGEGDDEGDDDDDDLMEEDEAGVEQQETCTSRETLPPLEEDHFRPNLTATASPTTIDQHLQSRVFATTGSSSVNPSLLVSQLVASSQNPTCALNNPVVMNRGTIAVLPADARIASAPPLQTVSEDQSEATPPITAPYPPDDSFVVVDSQQGGRNTASSSTHPANNASSTSTRQERKEERRKQQAIRHWQQDLLQKQRLQRQEWQLQQQQHHPQHASSTVVQQTTDDWWLDPESGHLAVFDQLPSPTNQKKNVGSLPPGSPVTAYKLYTLDSETLQLIQVDEEHGNDDKPTIPPSIGVVQMLEIHWNNNYNTSQSSSQSQSSPSSSSDPNLIMEQPTVGYCVYSVHGYAFLVPGHPSIYMNPQVWWWRVTCKVGAFLRQGLELSSDHRCTIPYGTFVQVTRKTVNRMGLSRLRVLARVDNKQVEGWCSEFLNPLSGQRGHVVQPLPFVVPALYRVTLPEGAVIRQDVELSSRQIGRAPYGTVLTIVQRQFSEHPQDQCVERLKLAGGDDTGWISVRLNQMPPEDCCVVELVGVDTRFQPDQPDEFHWQVFDEERIRQQQQQQQQQDPSVPPPSVNPNSADDLSCVEERGGSPSDAERLHPNQARPIAANAVAAAAPCHAGSKWKQQVESCLICLTEQRNATIVHGETGHIACCLVCARILRARGDRCPVCRLEIDAVIQHFWA